MAATIRPTAPNLGTTANPLAAGGAPLDDDAQGRHDSQPSSGVVVPLVPPDPPKVLATTSSCSADGWHHLRILGDTLDDLMRVRIAIDNRVRHAAIEAIPVEQYLAGLRETEAKMSLALRRAFRETAPAVAAWTKATPGLGDVLMSRLLGAIGDPLHAQPYTLMPDAPDGHECDPLRCGNGRHLVALEPFARTPRQLCAYVGWGDPANRRRAGMTADDAMSLGNQRAKALVWNLAAACMKLPGPGAPKDEWLTDWQPPENDPQPSDESPAILPTAEGPLPTDDEPSNRSTATVPAARRRSPYRDAYIASRRRTQTTHGDDWNPGHHHNAAIRYTAKAIVIDLWRVSNGQEPRWRR